MCTEASSCALYLADILVSLFSELVTLIIVNLGIHMNYQRRISCLYELLSLTILFISDGSNHDELHITENDQSHLSCQSSESVSVKEQLGTDAPRHTNFTYLHFDDSLNESMHNLSVADQQDEFTDMGIASALNEAYGGFFDDASEMQYEHANTFHSNDSLGDGDEDLSSFYAQIQEMIMEDMQGKETDIKNGFMGFTVNKSADVWWRHQPPGSGRDEDIDVSNELLTKVLLWLASKKGSKERVILAPDNKIAKNVIMLHKKDKKFMKFLLTFPLLHYRKSGISGLGTAYSCMGLHDIVKYMIDDDLQTEWAKLVNLFNIEHATKIIRRISQGLHIAFMIRFMRWLKPDQAALLRSEFNNEELAPSDLCLKWHDQYMQFMDEGSTRNNTFALHRDLSTHMDEIVSMYIAERVGGRQGYDLVLGVVKQALPFGFVNGRCSYAPMCAETLHINQQAGEFWEKAIADLFSLSHKGSKANFALDTIRERDHKEASAVFNPKSGVDRAISKMSLVDVISDVDEKKKKLRQNRKPDKDDDELRIRYSKVDTACIRRVASLFDDRNGLSTDFDLRVLNVYGEKIRELPIEILDRHSLVVGHYLLKKFACENNLFGLTMDDLGSFDDSECKDLMKRAMKKKSGGSSHTLVRVSKPSVTKMGATENELKEMNRKKTRSKLYAAADCLTSETNKCIAVQTPDLNKRGGQKGMTVKRAIENAVKNINPSASFISKSIGNIASVVKDSVTLCVVENAGWKFKLSETIGSVPQYLHVTRDKLIMKICCQFKSLKRMVLVEEKYYFTPDDLKAKTRSNRQGKKKTDVNHLKSAEELCNNESLYVKGMKATPLGRNTIGIVSGKHGGEFNLKIDLTLDVCSEWLFHRCLCTAKHVSLCTCDDAHKAYTTPVRYEYKSSGGQPECQKLDHIQQRKGEAEMGQIDWLVDAASSLKDGQAVMSVSTSGDVDTIVQHLFEISHRWPRCSNGTFKNAVYLWLQNPGTVYCITGIVRLFEKAYGDHAAMKVALAISMTGNDFIPQMYGFTHDPVLKAFLANKDTWNNLFVMEFNEMNICFKITIDVQRYEAFIKDLYTPSKLKGKNPPYDLVRLCSMKNLETGEDRPAWLWLVPMNCLRRIARLIQCHLDYMLTLGNHSAIIPKFLEYGCLKKNQDGDILYDLGDDARMDPEDIREEVARLEEQYREVYSAPRTPRKTKKQTKRQMDDTPQKGLRRKFLDTSTPKRK